MCDATASGRLGEKMGVCVPNFLQQTWEQVSIQKMSKRQEQQSKLGLYITICVHNKNRFHTSHERDEQGHLNVVEEKSADHMHEASPQCSNVLLCQCENVAHQLGGAKRLVNKAFEPLLPAVQPFTLEQWWPTSFALQVVKHVEHDAEAQVKQGHLYGWKSATDSQEGV